MVSRKVSHERGPNFGRTPGVRSSSHSEEPRKDTPSTTVGEWMGR